MPSTTPGAFFSAVFADYSVSAAALAVSGVPTAAQVQRRTLTTSDAVVNPHALFAVEADPDSSDVLIKLSFDLTLTAHLGTETGQTTRTQAQAWLQALRLLFTEDHRSTWQTFIESQTDEYRLGWNVQAIWPQPVTQEMEEEKNLLTITAPYEVYTFWNN